MTHEHSDDDEQLVNSTSRSAHRIIKDAEALIGLFSQISDEPERPDQEFDLLCKTYGKETKEKKKPSVKRYTNPARLIKSKSKTSTKTVTKKSKTENADTNT